MKENVFTKILLTWDGLKEKERLKLLQEYENEISKRQGRDARTIGIDRKSKDAYFAPETPWMIWLPSLKKEPAVFAMLDIEHEGFHAAVRDFIEDKCDIKTISEIDQKRFHEEIGNNDTIYDCALEMNQQYMYDMAHYEEVLAYKESSVQIAHNLFCACETKEDARKVYADCLNAITINIFEHLDIKDLEENGMNYDEILERARKIYRTDSNDGCEFAFEKEIYDNLCSSFLAIYDKIFNHFLEKWLGNKNVTGEDYKEFEEIFVKYVYDFSVERGESLV